MFMNCSSLNYITVLTTNNFTMDDWLSGVAASGTFVKNPNATWSSCGKNAYPCGWTVQDYVDPTPIKYEYQYSGDSWVNLGEVSGSSKTSDFKIGDVKERVTTSVSDGDYLLFSYYNKSDISKPENIMSYNPSNNYLSNLSGYGITTLDSTTIIDPSIWVLESTASANTFYIKSIKNNLYWGYQSRNSSRSLNLVDSSSTQKAPVLITPSCKENCYGFVEKKSNASTGYNGYGLNQLNSYTYQLNWWNDGSSNDPCDFFSTDGNADFIIYKMNANDAEYPKYYTEKSDPLNDLTFNTMAEAQTYAYNNCVYDGMKATIDGDRYYFDSSDENGWVKILEYYKVEDVTPNAASGWTISGSSTYNPDSSYYDDFDLETTSTSYTTKIAKVTIYGYDHFTYYLRSGGYSNNNYVVATNVDEISTPPSTMLYISSSAITHTYNFNKAPKSDVNLSNYRRVTYNNLDKTVEHTFYVYFYGRKYSSYVGTATILIPKEQTNENWEQVTFSASSNVASYQKNLYIDNNNSTSGGTNCWYYRWIVGLPSGSHSSNTNYSNYEYCPNTTSSTFTSVAGEQRQVNFTYDNTTNKTLSFRLTDGSNVLTPSDTVYYTLVMYNSCSIGTTSSNLTFPRSQTLKVGGQFYFMNSSNRHYIYGYQPPTLVTYYNVDNYQSTFDIVYTKLSDEAVTITYTTFDPNDSETPAFNTDITYPYNGGTTSSTTLTSFDVPYTYPYEVIQTNDKFSADSQSYTANQTARTINFTLYPNNREFATVADMEAYAYAWEGMRAIVGDTKYEYKNGEWVENQHSLPDVAFTVNYNAKNYNASTQTFTKTDGQLANTDVTISGGTLIAHDGYVSVPTTSRGVISGYDTYFNRTNSTPNLTIISKQRTEGSNCHMFANRASNYNWMYRPYYNRLVLHGGSEQGSIAVTTQPVIESVRVDSNRLVTYNNYTDNTSSTVSSFNYGGTNGSVALFAGFTTNSGEWFVGDFYWIYMSQTTLTDEQVQQVIDYNENL